MTQTNSAWKQRLTDMENKLAAARGDRERRSMDWESGVSRCKLRHSEWINSKVLMYSAGNYTEHL